MVHLLRSGRPRLRRSQPTADRLRLEALEDRNLPSFGPWSAPVRLDAPVNTPASDQHPALSPDGLSLYITSTRSGGYGSTDLWVCHRTTRQSPWGPATNIGTTINGGGRDFSPVFSPDGHWMIYARASDGNENNDDIYITHRADKRNDFGWETPVSLGPNINVDRFGDSGPSLFEDSATGLLNLYFTSNRPGGVGDWDIYRSVRLDDGTWTPAELVPEVSTSNRDVRTTIRGDGLEMIITSANPAYLPAPNPQAPLDLYVSTRPTTQSPWSTPVNLGLTVNSAGPTVIDSAPYLSRDGKTLLFYSNRPDSTPGPDGVTPSNDLYMCTRQELDDGEGAADVPADLPTEGKVGAAPATLSPDGGPTRSEPPVSDIGPLGAILSPAPLPPAPVDQPLPPAALDGLFVDLGANLLWEHEEDTLWVG